MEFIISHDVITRINNVTKKYLQKKDPLLNFSVAIFNVYDSFRRPTLFCSNFNTDVLFIVTVFFILNRLEMIDLRIEVEYRYYVMRPQ